MQKGFKISLIILIILFLGLFFSYRNGYYINKNSEKAILTEEAIREYENDLKKGIDVTKKDYLTTKESYDNNYTRFSLKLSKKIEKAFNIVIKYLFNKMGNEINK